VNPCFEMMFLRPSSHFPHPRLERIQLHDKPTKDHQVISRNRDGHRTLVKVWRPVFPLAVRLG